jgi:hypothetical protein
MSAEPKEAARAVAAARRALQEGQEAEALARVTEGLASGSGTPAEHVELADLALRLGRSSLAIRAWQLVLKAEPDRVEAWGALGQLHAERGEAERARVCLERAGLSAPAPEAVEPEAPLPPGPTDVDLLRFAYLFAGREGVHARMWHDRQRGTGYSPVSEPLSPAVVRAHLHGSITAGVYLLRSDGTAGQLVLDLDARKAALERAEGDSGRSRALRARIDAEGLRLYRAVRALGFDPLFVDSGFKGRHLWLFLEPAPPAELLIEAGRGLIRRLGFRDPELALELFPKQGAVREGGLGNLVKLPLGLHRRSGRWAALLDADGAPLADPFARLARVERTTLEALRAAGRPAASGEGVTDRIDEDKPLAEKAPAPPTVPLVEGPAWTAADFDTDAEVATLLEGCAPLRRLVKQALVERRLDRDGALVLVHTVGHLPRGPDAVNYLTDHVAGFPADQRMGARLRGSPVSCARIRSRLPALCPESDCRCTFPPRGTAYAHPLRHLDDGPRLERPRRRNLDELLRTVARQMERLAEAEAEMVTLRRAAVAALSEIPDGRWAVEGGEWALESDDGLPVLRFYAATPPAARGD